jgi:hypothetical protein
MNTISHKIEATESDGYKRGGVAYPIRIAFAEAELFGTGAARITHPDGRELPVQIDVDETWPDGSIKSCDVIFPLHLPANGSGTYTLETGPRILPSAEQRNPVQIDTTETGLTINQGPVTYTVRTNPFSIVDTAVFNRDVWKGTHPTGADISGPKPFLLPGSPGPALITGDGKVLNPSHATITVETNGPRTGRIRAAGEYNGSLFYTSRITFYSGVSWYRHTFELSGDTNAIASVVFEDTFDLAEGPLIAAFGARVNSHGHPTSWAVVTDGVSTIDIATREAWNDKGHVRYESEPDGRFRVIAPFTDKPIETFYHFLITPPADHYHTPAGAMVAEPHLRLLD